ncbi:MAG: hypothetical protein VKP72_10985 [bacterium]|nr:hypothetical protein [bacterium]
MKRLAALALVITTLPGCFVWPVTTYVPPMGAKPALPLGAVYEADGSSLADANHAVRQYLAQLAPDAKLLEIHATMVGTNSRIARTSAWEFIFEVPVAQPASGVTAAPLPSATPAPQTGAIGAAPNEASPAPAVAASLPAVSTLSAQPPKTTQLKMVYTGHGQLLAPRYGDAFSRNQPIEFSKTILLDEAIATALDIGMGVADPGMEVSLTTTPAGRVVYSIDSSYAERTVMGVQSSSSLSWRQTVTTGSGGLSSSGSGYSSDCYAPDSDRAWATPTGDGSRGNTAVIQAPASNTSFDRGAPGKVVYQPVSQARPIYVRGKYLIDALSGDIVQRPTRL